MAAWRPCEDELRRKRIKAIRMEEEAQRQKLTAASKGAR
jgi:hypothetical protein